ncbi:MAG: NfeD family protein, partial [Pirellulales bacterium]|nr:NfeD family protein [Pirellulales bacterium]
GDVGIADSPLRPAGRVRFGDQYVDVVSEGSFIEEGAYVRILKIRGNHILVRQVQPVTEV